MQILICKSKLSPASVQLLTTSFSIVENPAMNPKTMDQEKKLQMWPY